MANIFTKAASAISTGASKLFNGSQGAQGAADFGHSLFKIVSAPFTFISSAGSSMGGSTNGLVRFAGSILKGTDKLIGSTLSATRANENFGKNPIFRNAVLWPVRIFLYAAALTGLYKGVKSKLQQHNGKTEVNEINLEAAQIENDTAKQIYALQEEHKQKTAIKDATAYQVGNGYVGSSQVSSNHAANVMAARAPQQGLGGVAGQENQAMQGQAGNSKAAKLQNERLNAQLNPQQAQVGA